MRFTFAGLAMLAPLLVVPAAGFAQAPQGGTSGRGPEGNLQSGAAMGGAQGQSSGTPNTGTAAQPVPQTQSPRPSDRAGSDARQRPEGNLGSGAAMGGAQRESAGAAATGGAPPPRSPSTTSSPQSSGSSSPSR
ncbi:MAG: hypothetical protein ICV73_09800 [Acetobacteraceae bacterium]|nr:hypothetical protein [Acetobacteraceae bacterium]